MRLQKWLKEAILKRAKKLQSDDIVSRTAGVMGEDLILSPAARKTLPYTIECKNLARVAVYKPLEQAEVREKRWPPLVCIKANHKRPLIVVYADDFLDLVYDKRKNKTVY